MFLADILSKLTAREPGVKFEEIGTYSEEALGDESVLQSLTERGSDLTKPRHTLFYLYFETSNAAENAVRGLRDAGFIASNPDSPAHEVEYPWPVIAEKTYIVNSEVIAKESQFLNNYAAEYGGEYDGWEAAQD